MNVPETGMVRDGRASAAARETSAAMGLFKPWVLLMVLMVVTSYFLCLGKWPLQIPDEARYGEIAREMIEKGDWVTPTLNYVKYFEKPPLHYWITAVSFELFGMKEFAARFFPALLSLLTIGGVFLAARRLFGRRAGWNAALVLAGSPIWLVAGRSNVIDPVVSSLIALSLVAFLLFDHAGGTGGGRRWLAAFYVLAALAVLAKGLIGILFPFGTVLCYIVLSRRFRLLKELRPWLGIPLFLAVAAPWFVAVSLRNPDFAWFFFVHEHVMRFLTDVHNRTKPFYFFVPVLLIGLLPFAWSLFPACAEPARRAWKSRGKEGGAGLFLLIWAGLVFVFFSLSHSKLPLYILPLFPAVALLIGRYLAGKEERAFREGGPFPRALSLGLWTCLCLGLAAPLAAWPAAPYLPMSPWPYAAAAGAGMVFIFFLARRFWRRPAIGSVSFLFLASVFLILDFMLGFQEGAALRDSDLPLVRAFLKSARPGEPVVMIRKYRQDVNFYARRRVVLVDVGGELAFGRDHDPDRGGWFWSRKGFLEKWRAGRPMWVFVLDDKLEKKFIAAGRTLREELGAFREIGRIGEGMVLLTNVADRPGAVGRTGGGDGG